MSNDIYRDELHEIAVERFKKQRDRKNEKTHEPKYVIGITGDSGQGKTHAAKYICNQFGATKLSFADPLKKIAVEFGFKYNEVYGTQAEKEQKNTFYNISGREFMQKFGTEVCQQDLVKHLPTMNNVWIKLAMKKIADEKLDKVVFDDLRFVEEAKELHKYTCFIVEICNATDVSIYNNKHISVTERLKINADIKSSSADVAIGAVMTTIEQAYSEVYGK